MEAKRFQFLSSNTPLRDLLQAFVRERIVSFAGESAFSRRLNLAPSVVRNAAIAALTELALRGSELNSAADCGLIFRHDCL